jgi:hypothetical protein
MFGRQMEKNTIINFVLRPEAASDGNPAASGLDSAKSVYNCHFAGAMTHFPAKEIWKALSETKCISFVWLVMHNKVQSRDNLIKKN